jgi:putative membrane protein
MRALNKNLLRATAGVGATALALLSAPIAMGAADDDVVVTNTETVQVYMNADGEIDTQRVYEQLVLTGTGDVSVENPIETDGLRNLDGFSGYDIEDGKAVLDESVDGEERFRSVSDFDGELPLDVSIAYFLDGEEVEAGDVVGEEGQLEVVYRVENTTAETQTVEVNDGKGGTVTKEVDVVLPMVGSLSTVLPSNFTDVESAQANMAGDGRGGTKMSFTMTLFPPIGNPVAEFGYTATITDGVVPDATISALPVNPLEAASFKGGAASYKGGADTGAELTAGATEIDANLLKLRDGAADLSLGLIKLYDGASQLEEGLNSEAVPGAEQLYDGSIRLVDGTDQLEAGTVDLQDGADQLADGTTRLEDGATRLNEGAEDLSEGTTQLEDGAQRLNDGAGDLSAGADELDEGAARLDGGANRLADGLSEADGKAPDLVDGLKQVRGGLLLIDGGLAQMYAEVDGSRQRFSAGIQQMIRGIGSTSDAPGASLLGTLSAVRGGLQEAASELEGPINAQLPCAVALLNEMATGDAAPAPCRAGQPVGPGQVVNPDPLTQAVQRAYLANLRNGTSDLLTGLTGLRNGLIDQQSGAIVALTGVMCGLDSTASPMCGQITGGKPGLLQGINQLDAGITDLINGVTQGIGRGDDTPADGTLRGGVNGLQHGNDQLLDGAQALVAGIDQLAAGAGDLAEGTGDLADGTQQLSDGANTLSGGAANLFDGTVQLDDGAVQLFNGTADLLDGATQLEDGAQRLADGSVQLSEGAGDLSDGSGDLSDGLERLYQGLLTAGDGTSQLRDGLQQAKEGAPKIESGASQLSEQGTQKLVEAGSDTAVTFGEGYAMLTAGAERAETESMVYGAPEGAQGVTAYTYEIRGADGESSRNWGRGLAALAIFAAGTGLIMWRRGLC